MRLFRYWASETADFKDAAGYSLLLKKWAGSNASIDDAKEEAARRIAELVTRLKQKHFMLDRKSWTRSNDYDYGIADQPEELIELFDDTNGITRNRYGVLVLNTNALMFADIDLPKPGFGDWLAKLMGKPRPTPEEAAITKLKEWVAHHPGVSIRVYRTAAGLRYLFTDCPREVEKSTLAWLAELESDKLYTRLCGVQKCFRARLTPKPWRIEDDNAITRPANNYPREGAQQTAFDKWLANYEKKSAGYATCHFVSIIGGTDIHEDLAKLIDKHDEVTRANSSLPLA